MKQQVAKQGSSLAAMACFTALNMLGTFLRMTLPLRRWKFIPFYVSISLVCFLAKTKEYDIFPPVNTELTGFAGSSLPRPNQLFSEPLLLLSQLYKNRNYPKS